MSTHEAYEQRLAGLGTRLRTVEAQNTALRAQRDALKTALQGLATLAKDIPAHRGNPLESASWENAYGQAMAETRAALALPDPATGEGKEDETESAAYWRDFPPDLDVFPDAGEEVAK